MVKRIFERNFSWNIHLYEEEIEGNACWNLGAKVDLKKENFQELKKNMNVKVKVKRERFN